MEEPQVYKLYIQPGMKVLVGLIFIALAGIGAAIALSPSFLHGPKAPPPAVGVLFIVIMGLYLVWLLFLPYRIRLYQDGKVEFTSLLRLRTLRVDEIKSIKPDSGKFGFLMIRTQSGKFRILAQFDGFHDFLARLKAMHPGVELRGC